MPGEGAGDAHNSSPDLEAFLDDLAGWAADERARYAAAQRRREASLRRQAGEAATWHDLALGLAGRAAIVTVRMATGRSHTGRLASIGADFVALAAGDGWRQAPADPRDGTPSSPGRGGWHGGEKARRERPSATETRRPRTFLATHKVTAMLVAGPALAPPALIAPKRDLSTLADVMDALAADRRLVRIGAGPGEACAGELMWVGADVLALRTCELGAAGAPCAYIRLAEVSEVVLLE